MLRNWWHCPISGTVCGSIGTLFRFDVTPYHSQKMSLCIGYSFSLNICWRRWKWGLGKACQRPKQSVTANICVLITLKWNKSLWYSHNISKKFCWFRSLSLCSYHSLQLQHNSLGHRYDIHKRSIHAYHMFSPSTVMRNSVHFYFLVREEVKSCHQVTVTRSYNLSLFPGINVSCYVLWLYR